MQYNNQQGDGLEEIRRRMAHKEEIFRQQRVSQRAKLEAQGNFASTSISKRVSIAAAEIMGAELEASRELLKKCHLCMLKH